MDTFTQLHQQLGLMTIPLLICSALTLLIILERLIHLFTHIGGHRRDILLHLNQIEPKQLNQIESKQELNHIIDEFSARRSLIFKGAAMILSHQNFNKALREDAAALWLEQKRHQLNSGLRILTLIGVISPLLGLLGTVLGLIEMFQGMANTTGNVTPSDLADGLGVAMSTTAVGLLIALPAIVGAQLLGLWADKCLARLENVLNFVNLWLEGMVLSSPAKSSSAISSSAMSSSAEKSATNYSSSAKSVSSSSNASDELAINAVRPS